MNETAASHAPAVTAHPDPVTLVNILAAALSDARGPADVVAAVASLEREGTALSVWTRAGDAYVPLVGAEGEPGPDALPLRAFGRVVGALAVDESVGADAAAALAVLLGAVLAAGDAERRRAELESVLDLVEEGVFLRVRDGVRLNDAARRLLAIPPGTEYHEGLVPPRRPDGAPLPREEFPSVEAIATGRPVAYRMRATRLDGHERLFAGVAAPVRLADGEIAGSVSLFRDVTDEGLSERLLERLFKSLPTAIVVAEPGSERVLVANPAFLALVGYEEHEVVGAVPPYPWWDSEPAAPVEEWDDVRSWEQVFRRKDGTAVPVEGERFALRGATGEAQRAVSLITDLSERRRFEQQLVQSGKLAALGELAAGVAHEINNPLFAILGLVEFLLKDAEPGTKAHDRLSLVQQTGLEIKEIVRGLLDFARERSDEFTRVSLGEVASQAVALVRRATAAKSIELVAEGVDEQTPVEASANQLKQVVLNLVTNAQHALADGGTITVRVGREDGWATLSVTDTGPGIPPEIADRIFDPFFTTKRDLGGTGLGLSVSLGIAQMHGGDLTVSSPPGGGATFTLRLPLAQE